jgi:hypothetical protein
MLQTTDQGHFFKYLTTLGVAVIAASLTAGGLLLNVQNNVLIEKARIVKLTPVAQEIVAKKQSAVLAVTEWAPLAVILLSVVGIALVVVGLVGWKRRQDTLDARDRAELNKTLVEVQQMTDQEKNDKVQAEAREIVESDIVAQFNRESSTKSEAGTHGADLVVPSMKRIAETVREQEADLIAKLSQAFPHDEIRSGVAIHSDSTAIYVDALVVQERKRRLYAIELKIYGNSVRMQSIVAAVNQVSALSAMLEDRYNNFVAFPVLVIITESLGMARRQRLRDSVELHVQAMRNTPSLLIYSPAEFKDLTPSAFNRDITSARLRQNPATAN